MENKRDNVKKIVIEENSDDFDELDINYCPGCGQKVTFFKIIKIKDTNKFQKLVFFVNFKIILYMCILFL